MQFVVKLVRDGGHFAPEEARTMAFKILAIGEILWDLLPSGPQVGGAPANYACHAKALGAEARLVSRVGNDERGHEIVRYLAERRLPTDTIQIDSAAPTGAASVQLDGDGGHRFTIHRDTAWDHLHVDEYALATAKSADAVCFGTLGQRGLQSQQSCQTLVAATRPDALRVLDINLRENFFDRAVVEQSLAIANVLKLNEDELGVVGEMFDIGGSAPERLERLARRFDLNLVALTRGAHGSLLYSAGSLCEHSGLPVEVRNTIGAGDSFAAAMTIGLLAGWDLDEISRRANEVAAEVCAQTGSAAPLSESLAQCFQMAVV